METFLKNLRASLGQQVPLKTQVKNNLSHYHRTEEGLEIRKLKTRGERKDEYNRIRKASVGQETQCPTKVILVVGATGAGKTTLINAMVNFLYGIDFTDDFRLILIDEQDTHRQSQAESQTDFITAYTLYYLTGMPFQYNFVVIDTPGFGDTQGIYRDREMIEQFGSFLKQDNGISQIDCVGLVTPASAARLSHTQRYVYDGLSSMFGKDIMNNVYVMATFADAKTPPVLEGLKEADVHYVGFYKFNNSALYAQNTETESDDDEINITKLFWDMGCRSMKKFFLKLGKTTPVSLTLTREVLKLRNQLQLKVGTIQDEIHIGVSKLTSLNKERDMLRRHSDDMRGSENHTQVVNVPKITKINLRAREHVSNCIQCNYTCHYPCSRGDDSSKVYCSAMVYGSCRVCPGKCHWSNHKDMRFRYQHTNIKENRINLELFNRYHAAQHRMLTSETSVKAKEIDICHHTYKLGERLPQAQTLIRRLEDIALKANPLSTKEYVDLLIESEKTQKCYNFQRRIEMLQKLKEEAAIVEGIRGNCSHLHGESLLLYFQNHICKQLL